MRLVVFSLVLFGLVEWDIFSNNGAWTEAAWATSAAFASTIVDTLRRTLM
jgi:hypothetical protein